jgi:hypothetical protein
MIAPRDSWMMPPPCNDDGTIEIEFAYDNGDEAVLNAKRVTSSTAC